MNLREFLEQQNIKRIKKEVDPRYELAAIQNQIRDIALYENVNSEYQVVSGICSKRQYFADALGIKKEEIIKKMASAIEKPTKNEIVQKAPCQEKIEAPDLDTIPILTHFKTDGGPYITSGIAIIKDPDYGVNACYHRLMKTSKNTFTARIIEGRGTHTALKKTDELEVAICIGAPMQVLLSASMSPEKGINELEIANYLRETPLVKCRTKDLEVPAESELVLEGTITKECGVEGPFVDLTNTIDKERSQPVLRIDKITHRENPIYHALLPAGEEHKNLMGMPREPTMFHEVNKQCECKNVLITPGGCSWLHAVIQIKKKNKDDGLKAINQAFKGHGSLKHCVIVDEDINIYDPEDVEWAIATRFQADKDMVVKKDQPSSSLDPSADKPEGEKARTSKMGLDATKPGYSEEFGKKHYEDIDLNEFSD